MAAIHHPHLIAALQPDTDPVAVAREVLDQLDELRQAADAAEAEQDSGYDRRQSVDIRRDGDAIVISPGDELRSLGWCLEVFAGACSTPPGVTPPRREGPPGMPRPPGRATSAELRAPFPPPVRATSNHRQSGSTGSITGSNPTVRR